MNDNRKNGGSVLNTCSPAYEKSIIYLQQSNCTFVNLAKGV